MRHFLHDEKTEKRLSGNFYRRMEILSECADSVNLQHALDWNRGTRGEIGAMFSDSLSKIQMLRAIYAGVQSESAQRYTGLPAYPLGSAPDQKEKKAYSQRIGRIERETPLSAKTQRPSHSQRPDALCWRHACQKSCHSMVGTFMVLPLYSTRAR